MTDNADMEKDPSKTGIFRVPYQVATIDEEEILIIYVSYSHFLRCSDALKAWPLFCLSSFIIVPAGN
jgi:hypothetical protein